jgi:ribosomal-protein-alanine N-acetyltransferase
MILSLRPIELNVDKSDEVYNSDNCQMLLKTYDEYYLKIGYNLPWVGYFVVRDNTIVGSCGFTGEPNDGKVEIAYWTFEEFEGQGIASFSCKELVIISEQFDPNITITAKTAPEHNASSKILQKNGFSFAEVVQDDEIGDAWLWILNR